MQKLFRRKIYSELSKWKSDDADGCALLIEGARRIGKSTIVEQFAKENYQSYILVDFSKAETKPLIEFINKGFNSLDFFFLQLQTRFDTRLYAKNSLIIFDEVQFCPSARQMIKELVADGRYHYVETGSLISIKKHINDILIPSEESSIHMYPMASEEFLRYCFDTRTPLGQSMHRQIMELYHTYMLVGGMPQAVSAFVETNNFKMVEKQKRTILELYQNDSGKISERMSEKCSGIFSKIPSLLSKHDKSFKPSAIRKGGRTRDYLDAIYSLERSKMVLLCERNSDVQNEPELTLDEENFKLYLSDTGLLFTMVFQNNVGDPDEIYAAILDDKMNLNEGMFFENMVAQTLSSTGHKLYFSKFRTKESSNLQEVDFLIPRLDRLIPVEVKSARSGAHASLDRFMEKHSKKVEKAYVIHSKDLRVDGKIVYIPIYMTGFVE
ncbi:MAG: AAA family ATPase [archaeon]|nr:AAA family ATPase [archaeon]